MQPVQQTPKHELVATHLREGMREGRWSGNLPGVLRLAAELDVSPFTVRRALRQLQTEGMLADSGLGRSRSISATGNSGALRRSLRVAILGHDAQLADCPQPSLVLIDIMQSLETAGIPSQPLVDRDRRQVPDSRNRHRAEPSREIAGGGLRLRHGAHDEQRLFQSRLGCSPREWRDSLTGKCAPPSRQVPDRELSSESLRHAGTIGSAS